MNEEREFLGVVDVARAFGVSRQRAHELVSQGHIKSFRIGKRWWIPREALEELKQRATGKSQAV